MSNPPSFISNLDASYIEVLVKTAARSQAPALKDLLYKHLVSRASIGVTLPVSIDGRPHCITIVDTDPHISLKAFLLLRSTCIFHTMC
jgi:hypothetical protein